MNNTMRYIFSILITCNILSGCATVKFTLDQEPESLRTEILVLQEIRRQVHALGIIEQLEPDRFRQADIHYRKAILKARNGDFLAARKRADRALKLYREATLLALEKGAITKTQGELERGAGTALPDRLKTRAQQHIDKARSALTQVRGKPFQIVAVSDAVLSELYFVGEILETRDIVVGPHCPEPVQPEIFDFEISPPPPGNLLAHPPIYYITGDAVDVSLLIPNCTSVSNVSLVLFQGPGGTIELGTDPLHFDPIEGTSNDPYYYTVELDVPQPNDRHRMTIRLHFPDFDDGRSIGVRITAESAVSAPGFSQVLAFTAALVKEVNGKPRFGLSENDLRNSFIVGIYNEFGDDGRSDALYDPAYDGLVLEIEEDGVHYEWQVKTEIDFFCDPTVKISGIFNLVPDGNQIQVVWVDDGPDIELDYGFRIDCDIADDAIFPIMLAKVFALASARQSVRQSIQEEIDPLLVFLDPQVGAFIETIETRRDEIQVVFQSPTTINVPGFSLEDVTLELPYGRLRLDEPMDLA